jgi:hypothetical protein
MQGVFGAFFLGCYLRQMAPTLRKLRRVPEHDRLKFLSRHEEPRCRLPSSTRERLARWDLVAFSSGSIGSAQLTVYTRATVVHVSGRLVTDEPDDRLALRVDDHPAVRSRIDPVRTVAMISNSRLSPSRRAGVGQTSCAFPHDFPSQRIRKLTDRPDPP